MRLTRDWPHQLEERWGIRTLTSTAHAPSVALWVSRCAATKRVKRGTPRELYNSPLLDYFFRFAEVSGLSHAVLSDCYGLHYHDERLDWYDLHPSSLTTAEKQHLGHLIRAKAFGRGYTSVVFYNGSPIRSVPYFEMLAASQLDVWYTTRLPYAGADSKSRVRP